MIPYHVSGLSLSIFNLFQMMLVAGTVPLKCHWMLLSHPSAPLFMPPSCPIIPSSCPPSCPPHARQCPPWRAGSWHHNGSKESAHSGGQEDRPNQTKPNQTKPTSHANPPLMPPSCPCPAPCPPHAPPRLMPKGWFGHSWTKILFILVLPSCGTIEGFGGSRQVGVVIVLS